MQKINLEAPANNEDFLHFTPKKRSPTTRKWRQIEDLKARQGLLRELKEIDQSFEFSISDLT